MHASYKEKINEIFKLYLLITERDDLVSWFEIDDNVKSIRVVVSNKTGDVTHDMRNYIYNSGWSIYYDGQLQCTPAALNEIIYNLKEIMK